MPSNFGCDVYMLCVFCRREGMGVGRCERGVSHRVFLLVCGASAARAHSRGSGSGGRFCFLGREGAGRVVEACLL